MKGNDKYKEEREARRAAEMWAGAKLVSKNMAEGVFAEMFKDWKMPSPQVHIPSPDKSTWEVHARYYVDGIGDVLVKEPYETFPSELFMATITMLGLKR